MKRTVYAPDVTNNGLEKLRGPFDDGKHIYLSDEEPRIPYVVVELRIVRVEKRYIQDRNDPRSRIRQFIHRLKRAVEILKGGDL